MTADTVSSGEYHAHPGVFLSQANSSVTFSYHRSWDENLKQGRQHEDEESSLSFNSKATSVRNGIFIKTVSYGRVLLFAQFLSFLLAVSSAANAELHLRCDMACPGIATFLVFSLLSFFLIPLYYRGHSWKQLQAEGLLKGRELETPMYEFLGIIPIFASVWSYLGIGFISSGSDYLTVLAARYTTLTSVTIFGSLSVPSAMVLSALFLGRKYRAPHILGATVCILGIVVDVLMDYQADQQEETDNPAWMFVMTDDDDEDEPETFFDYDEKAYPHKVWGDLLAISGGILFGAIDTLAEYSARQFGGPMEFLAMVGVWAGLITGCLALMFEREQIGMLRSGNDECSQVEMSMLVGTYVMALSMHIVGVAYFVLFSESALLNMSCMTANFWSVGFSVMGTGGAPDPLFYVALLLVTLGIFIYEAAPSPVPDDETPVIDDFKEMVEPVQLEHRRSNEVL